MTDRKPPHSSLFLEYRTQKKKLITIQQSHDTCSPLLLYPSISKQEERQWIPLHQAKESFTQDDGHYQSTRSPLGREDFQQHVQASTSIAICPQKTSVAGQRTLESNHCAGQSNRTMSLLWPKVQMWLPFDTYCRERCPRCAREMWLRVEPVKKDTCVVCVCLFL